MNYCLDMMQNLNIRMFVNEIGGAKSVEETKQMTLDLMKNSFFDFADVKEVK